MARPLRVDVPEGLYHVTSRGLARRAIVRDDADRERAALAAQESEAWDLTPAPTRDPSSCSLHRNGYNVPITVRSTATGDIG